MIGVPSPPGQYECHGNFFTFSSKGNQQQAPPVMGPNPKNFKGKFCPITWDELNSGKEIPKIIFGLRWPNLRHNLSLKPIFILRCPGLPHNLG
jgi:hypothetical protein